MKLLIAITLFVAVSALPQSHKLVREDPPIIFRHWEPTPDLDVRNLQNEHNRFEIIKHILNMLPPLHNSEANDDHDRKISFEDIINALNTIHHILNDNNDDDDDVAIPAINDSEDEYQSDQDSEGETTNLEPPPHRDELNSDDENVDNDSQSNETSIVQNVGSEKSNEIINKREDADRNQFQPQGEEEVVFMPRPFNLIPHSSLKGIKFPVPDFVQQQESN